MSLPLFQQITALDAGIARLQLRKDALEAQRPAAPWPRQTRIYASLSKDNMWDWGSALGLTGDALTLFRHFDEIALDIQVAQDGKVTLLACNGRPLSPAKQTEGA